MPELLYELVSVASVLTLTDDFSRVTDQLIWLAYRKTPLPTANTLIASTARCWAVIRQTTIT
jgi:hypothetical protein